VADERADVLMKLADFRVARRHERRQLEWRFSIAVWAALGGLIFKGFSLPCWPLPAIVSVFLVIVLFHAWWIGLNWVRNERDIRKAFFYIDRVHAGVIHKRPLTEPPMREAVRAWLCRHDPILEKPNEWPLVRKRGLFGCLLDPMYLLEVTVTVGLAAAAFLVGQQHCSVC
jgi:hypothetical protein